MALHDDLRAAIDKNLSAETAGVLRARLDSIDGLEKRVADLTSERDSAVKTRDGANNTVKQLAEQKAELEKRIVAFELREDLLAGAERNILVANMQREKADAVVDAIRGVVGQVFSNATLKRSIMTNATEPAYVPPSVQNSSGYVQQSNRTETKTITEEG